MMASVSLAGISMARGTLPREYFFSRAARILISGVWIDARSGFLARDLEKRRGEGGERK